MSKIILKLAVFMLVIFVKSLYPPDVFAQNINIQCGGRFANYVSSASFPAQANLGEAFDITVKFNSVADTSFNYYIKLTQFGTARIGNIDVRTPQQNISPSNLQATFSIAASGLNSNESTIGNFTVSLIHSEGPGEEGVCRLGNINFVDQLLNSTQCNIRMPNNVQQDQSFFYNIEKNDPPGINFFLYFFRAQDINNNLRRGNFSLSHPLSTWDRPEFSEMYRGVFPNNAIPVYRTRIGPNTSPAIPPNLGHLTITYDNSGSNRLNGGEYVAVLEAARDSGGGSSHFFCSAHRFRVSTEPTSDLTDSTPVTQPGQGGTIGGGEFVSETCLERAAKDPDVKCAEAVGVPCGTTDNPGFKTAIGCIHTNPVALVKDFLKFGLGIAGGLAFLLMLLGAFQMLTSAGNPETLATGKDRLTNAVIGLLFVIFSVLLLQIIGIGILDIPGFGR